MDVAIEATKLIYIYIYYNVSHLPTQYIYIYIWLTTYIYIYIYMVKNPAYVIKRWFDEKHSEQSVERM